VFAKTATTTINFASSSLDLMFAAGNASKGHRAQHRRCFERRRVPPMFFRENRPFCVAALLIDGLWPAVGDAEYISIGTSLRMWGEGGGQLNTYFF
jgi:hypothetical protein